MQHVCLREFHYIEGYLSWGLKDPGAPNKRLLEIITAHKTIKSTVVTVTLSSEEHKEVL